MGNGRSPGPSWTVLNDPDPSGPSSAPSEDELLLSSEDKRNETESTLRGPLKKRKIYGPASGDELALGSRNAKKARKSGASTYNALKHDGVPLTLQPLATPDKHDHSVTRLGSPVAPKQVARKRPPKKKPIRSMAELQTPSGVSTGQSSGPSQPRKHKDNGPVKSPTPNQPSLGARENGRPSSSSFIAQPVSSSSSSSEAERNAVPSKPSPSTLYQVPVPLLAAPRISTDSQVENASTMLSTSVNGVTGNESLRRPLDNRKLISSRTKAKDRRRLNVSLSPTNAKSSRSSYGLDSTPGSVATATTTLLKPWSPVKRAGTSKRAHDTSISLSSEESFEAISSISDLIEASNNSSSAHAPSSSHKIRNEDWQPKTFPLNKRKKPKSRQPAVLANAQRMDSATQARRKLAVSADPIELTSSSSDSARSKVHRAQKSIPPKRPRNNVPFKPPDDVIEITDDDDDSVLPNLAKKSSDIVLKFHADGSILIDDDDDDVDDDGAPIILPQAVSAPADKLDGVRHQDLEGLLSASDERMQESTSVVAIPQYVADRSQSADELDVLRHERSPSVMLELEPVPATVNVDLDLGHAQDPVNHEQPHRTPRPMATGIHDDTTGESRASPSEVVVSAVNDITDSNEDAELATSVSSQLQISLEHPARHAALCNTDAGNLLPQNNTSDPLHIPCDTPDEGPKGASPISATLNTQQGIKIGMNVARHDTTASQNRSPPLDAPRSMSISLPRLTRVSGSLYSGPHGFFKDVFEVREKSRSLSRNHSEHASEMTTPLIPRGIPNDDGSAELSLDTPHIEIKTNIAACAENNVSEFSASRVVDLSLAMRSVELEDMSLKGKNSEYAAHTLDTTSTEPRGEVANSSLSAFDVKHSSSILEVPGAPDNKAASSCPSGNAVVLSVQKPKSLTLSELLNEVYEKARKPKTVVIDLTLDIDEDKTAPMDSYQVAPGLQETNDSQAILASPSLPTTELHGRQVICDKTLAEPDRARNLRSEPFGRHTVMGGSPGAAGFGDIKPNRLLRHGNDTSIHCGSDSQLEEVLSHDALDTLSPVDDSASVGQGGGDFHPSASPYTSQEEEEVREIVSYPNATDLEMLDGRITPVPSQQSERRLQSHTSLRSPATCPRPQRSYRRSWSPASSSVGPRTPEDDMNVSVKPRIVTSITYTELELVTSHHADIVRAMAASYPRAKDIPHDLQDRINALNPAARRAGNMQVLLFEAAIAENTADDEPHAPPIRIINYVDDELTPPFEFHYSNRMWHGNGVPKPDVENLRGCDCRGPCDPNSTTCVCLKRQEMFTQGHDVSGFLYVDGKLKHHDFPIFECNDLCGCSEECVNRVVQHGRKVAINIRKTKHKGWGIFAGDKKIPKDTYIGVYAGEYLTDAEAEQRGIIYNKFGRTYLFDLDFYHLQQSNTDWEPKYSIDAYHAGNFTRYLNHSCEPNCDINPCYINEANLDKPLLTIFTVRDVAPGEELCFSYFGAIDEDEEPQAESRNYNDAVYVPCRCGSKRCRGNMWK